jgi:iron complex outermembrane receptor protein
LRYKTLYIALLATLQVNAQIGIQHDTIKISEVVISGKQVSAGMTGFKSIQIEQEGIDNYGSSTLGEILSSISPLFVKDYGAGGTSTPSFRGTGASHTLLLWNGININHPMVGQSDLSLVSSGLMDQISISPGSSSMSSGSGGLGGSIDLGNTPDWGKKTRIIFCPGLGSFRNYTGFTNVAIGTNNFITVTKAFFQNAENNFTFLDTYSGIDPVLETRKNGQVNRKGLMQELYFRKSGSILSARLWYQTASRNLQMPVISQQVISGEKQFDESLRSMIDYAYKKHSNEYFLTAAWMLNRLDYTNRLASIDSKNLTVTLIVKAGMSGKLNENIKLRVDLKNELNSVNSNNYASHISRNNTSLTVSAERKTGERFGTTLLLREIIDNKIFLIPDFSAGFEFRLVPWDDYLIYSNFSRNSRIATLNDLYWSPGGNPDLKNEYAYSYELGYRMSSETSSSISLSTDISLFSSYIRNMIQWHPGEYTYWTADNLKSVNASGVELFTTIKYIVNRLSIRVNAGYTYTRSVSNDIENDDFKGKQLIYIPENQANGVIRFGYGNFYSSWITCFTGKRFISVDNSDFLPGYTLNNLVNGFKVSFNHLSADINFRVDNLFNISYQSIAYYPQPGRSYFLSIKLQYDK